MDLSGIIFAALAVGWAVYLIPKALQHNEELAKSRAVSTFSGRMRVLGSGQEAASQVLAAAAPGSREVTQPKAPLRITRDAARRAARRRRRVLLVLVFALGTVGALTYFAIAPVWAPAIPGGLVVLFLVVARISVRRQTRRLAATPLPSVTTVDDTDTEDETQGIDVSEVRETAAEAFETVAARTPQEPRSSSQAGRAEAPVAEQPIADEGSLWDPLPLTLPTYVTKPTARRTVRTISLTQTTSSGHDAADTKLAREAQAVRKAQAEQEVPGVSSEETAQRKVAGA